MIISERIFYIMEQKNMSQLELSRRTGIATSNISDWKKKKTNPKADCLLSICDALDITPEQLLTGKGIDPEYKDTDMAHNGNSGKAGICCYSCRNTFDVVTASGKQSGNTAEYT